MRQVTASQTIALDTKAKAMLAAGQDVINLSVGELDFAAPTAVQVAVTTQVSVEGMNRYSPVPGLPAAKQAVVEYEQRQHGVEYAPDQVLLSNGAKQALYVAFQTLVEPGDEVLVIQPGWVSYVEQIKLAGGVPVSVESDEQFLPTIAALQQVTTARTKGLILNYPNNPTGAVYPEELLQQIAALAAKHNWWVVSDEIYEHILYSGEPFHSFAAYYPNTVVVNGLSKAAAVTGWRIGYAVGPKPIMAAMTAIQSHLTGNVSNVMQAALAPGLAAGLPAEWLTALQERRQLILDWVVQQPKLKLVAPAGAFYCFIDIRAISMDSVTFCEQLLQQQQVALVPGLYFGRDGYVRLSFASALPKLQRALERIGKFVL
jgi:aspartate aminotransferase